MSDTTTPTGQYTVEVDETYSLGASIRFLEGFAPASYEGSESATLRLAFIADGLYRAEQVGGAEVVQHGARIVVATYGAAAPETVRDQVMRILSLDVDAAGFPEVGKRDPVVGQLQARYPGLRPVLFHSPYEAAAWAIIGNRIRITQAARLKARMAEQLGSPLTIRGERVAIFPGPSRLAALDDFPGLFGRKVEYLQGLSEAASAGELEVNRLRAMPVEDALVHLKRLKGVGDFAAQLILLRGAGVLDALPTSEPRLARAVAIAYGLDHVPDNDELSEIAAAWRPYRTWVALLLRTMLEDETGEITGQRRQAES